MLPESMVVGCEQPGGGCGVDLWCICGYPGCCRWVEVNGVGVLLLVVVDVGAVVDVGGVGLALSAQGELGVGLIGTVFHGTEGAGCLGGGRRDDGHGRPYLGRGKASAW